MERLGARIVLAVLLIAAGIVLLLSSLDLVEIGTLLWAAIFVVAGLGFLAFFAINRGQWWALIPGLILLSLAILMAGDFFFPGYSETWGAALFLAGVGLPFWIIFAMDREQWWAIIPGGVLWTVAVVAGLASTMGDSVASILFLGLGLTFLLVFLVPTSEGRMRWALIPAFLFLGIGLIVSVAMSTTILSYVWPLALILSGLYLLFRVFTSRRAL